jgi:HSP20 family protein
MTTTMEPVAPWLRDLNRFFTNEGAVTAFIPPADVIVADDGVRVYMDVPGVSGEQLDIELENDLLTVRGERPLPYEARDGGNQVTRRIERAFGRFERTLRVPRGLDPDSIKASLKDGVLMLQVPKPESLKPRKIQIQGGDGQPRDIEGTPRGADTGAPA